MKATPPNNGGENSAPVFLTAKWRYLAMLNYAIEPRSRLGLPGGGLGHQSIQRRPAEMMNTLKPKTAGWILYDDSCGICRRWVPFWETTLQKRGFEIAPLQADWVRKKLSLNNDEVLQDLRLLLPDGRLISGADTYRYAMKTIWWAWPVYLFSIAPAGRNIFDWGYRRFASNRHKLSAACHLPGSPD